MARISNKKKYPLITPKDEDFLVATQESTGSTRSIKVKDLMTKFQENINIKQAPIEKIKLGDQEVEIEEYVAKIPNKLSSYDNDMGYENTENFTPSDYSKLINVDI